MRNQRKFTLIELFLTLALITMVGSALLMQGKPMLDRYRFRQGVAKLEREILFSKRIAQIAHADIEFQIKDTKKGLECRRLTDEPINIPHTFKVAINIPHLHLEQTNHFSVIFTGSGALIGKKHLTVQGQKERLVIKLP